MFIFVFFLFSQSYLSHIYQIFNLSSAFECKDKKEVHRAHACCEATCGAVASGPPRVVSAARDSWCGMDTFIEICLTVDEKNVCFEKYLESNNETFNF